MIDDLRTLIWLQWKLTVAIFRRRQDAQGWARILQVLLQGLQLIFTLPFFLLLGAGMAVALAFLSPDAAYEVVMVVNAGMLFIWMLLPSIYSGELLERFEMSRLFAHPISFRSIWIGSALISMLSMTGLWTVPLLLGQIIGLAWHQPLALPLIVLAALPLFGVLALIGRLMEDLFDLVAGDRRLQGLLIFVLASPFVLVSFGQWYFQLSSENYERVPPFLERLLGTDRLAALGHVESISEFLEVLALSRLLVWLPTGWGTAAMGLPALGQWGRGVLFLLLSLAAVVLFFWIHAQVTHRLMQGVALSIGAERVRSRRFGARLPGPPAFWALFHKDLLHLWRNPMPRRLLFAAPFMVVGMVPAMQALQNETGSVWGRTAPMLITAFVLLLLNMMFNMGLAANYWGTFDREGYATLAASPLDRRYYLLSANLAMLLFITVVYVVLMLAAAGFTGLWHLLPLGLFLGVSLQLSCLPAYNVAAIIGPYRMQLQWQSQQFGNLWGFIGLLASPPVLLLVLVPYVLWPPGLALTLPAALIYSLGIYGLTLKPLAQWLQRREFQILAKVTSDD